MCSRYNLISPPEAVCAYFGLPQIEPFPPRYNIAPTQPVCIIRRSSGGHREGHLVRWGLIPGWVKDPRKLSTLFTARAETAADKPSFRGGLRHRRCLVPANGFYEWSGPTGSRVPHMIRPADGGLMALGAIADHWLGADGSELETMAILTIPANDPEISHSDRVPLMLPPETFAEWLDCRPGESLSALALMRNGPHFGKLERIPVSPLLNDVANDGPELIAPLAPRLL
jgi:putative SOS response-associated peptidase YedK